MKTKKEFIVGFISSVVLTIIFLNSYLLNLGKPLSLSHGDSFLVTFILNHYTKSIFDGNLASITTLPMYYGFNNSLFFTDHHLVYAFIILPIYTFTRNIILSVNILYVLTTIASLFSMYLLSFYLTKKILPSILASVIFVFNPYVFARYPDHLNLITLQWIPLIFLFFEKSIRENSQKSMFLMFIFLTLQLNSSLNYSALLSAIFPFYALIRSIQEKFGPKMWINRWVLTGFGVFLIAILLNWIGFSQVISKDSVGRSRDQTIIFSAWVSDWLFTSTNNLIYGSLKSKALAEFPDFVNPLSDAEHSLFPGITVLIILISSFFILKKTTNRKMWFVFSGFIILSFLLSLGPRIFITKDLTSPGIYDVLYSLNPLFSFIRVASRFGVFVFLFLGLIAALVFSAIMAKLSSKSSKIFALVVISIVLMEYWNKPFEYTSFNAETINFYKFLEGQKSIQVILNLPLGNLLPPTIPQARSIDDDTHYLLYASTLHSKTLLDGNSGFAPQEYYKRAQALSINFPTVSKVEKVREWGADAIILHKDEYANLNEFEHIKNGLNLLNMPIIYSTDNLLLYYLKEWEAKIPIN